MQPIMPSSKKPRNGFTSADSNLHKKYNGYQRTSILNITKDIAHQYGTFNPSHHEPINDSSSNEEENMSEITDENYSNITDEKLEDFGDLLQTQSILT